MILDSTSALEPTDTLSYADTKIGIPTLLICLQVIPFACLFHYAYSVKPYTALSSQKTSGSHPYVAVIDSEIGLPQGKRYQGGPLGIYAWLMLFNPVEFFRDIFSTYAMFRDSKSAQMDNAMNMDTRY